jgi:asparagine synthase (glutamine-hydrolysing)
MIFKDRYIIVFNGEIYNYIELRKQLQNKGVQFVTESDTEVLLRLIILEGPAALNKLNGMWSFVMYDDVEQSLFISRDRMGKKPFYYVSQNGQFAFASEMKSLYGLLPNFSYNHTFIEFAVANPMDNEILDDTLINGIQKFPSGSYGIYKAGQLTISRYYFPEKLLEGKPQYRNFNEAVEQFNELFESSCTLRMRSDVPVGSALSGGIDSGFIVSTIAKLGFAKHGVYKALVSSFPGSFLDETADATTIAQNAGVAIEPVVVEPDLHPDHILHAVYQFEEIGGTSPIPFFQLYRAFRKHNRFVTLDGHGSDELFGGYSFDLYEKLKDDFPDIFEMRNTLNSIDKMYGFSNDITLKQTIPHFKGQLLKKIRQKKLTTVFEKDRYYKQRLFHSTFRGMLPTLLRNYDKYSMAAGVEVRMPFLDYRIVDFAFSLPNNYKLRNGFTKAIVRTAAKAILPASILKNKVKTGWNSPMGEWFAGPWKQWLLDEVASQGFKNCDLIDQTKIRNNIKKFYDNGQDHNSGQNLWIQLQPYLIEKANKVFI